MTGPPFSDLVGQYGVGSKSFQDQLNSFNAIQDAFMQAQQQRLQGQFTSYGVDPTQAQGVTYPQTHAAPPADPNWHDEDLMGAAQSWGIPEQAARAMPREQLIQIINEQRSNARIGGSTIDPTGIMVPARLLASFGLGAAEAITGGLHNLPIIGEALGRIELLHNADLKLRALEEGVRASTPESMQWLNTGANVAGNIAAMWYPASAAWSVAGKLGGLIPFLNGSRVAMSAFQGGASAGLLEGGSDAFKEHPVMFTALGAGLGVAGEKVATWLSTRVTKSFVPDAMLGPELPPGGLQQNRLVRGPGQFSEAVTAPGPISSELPTPGIGTPTGLGDEGMVLSGPDAFFGFRQPTGLGVQQADALSAGMNKAATIVQSPVFPEIAGQAQIDDLAVARAAEATNPGGSHIIQGVVNPGEFIMNLGENAHFVPRQGRLDALILPKSINAETATSQYAKFGFYDGQEVMTPDGMIGTVSGLDKTGAVFTPSFSGALREVSLGTLQGMVTSPDIQEAPQLWEAFVGYADHRAGGTAAAMSRTPTVEQIASVKQQNLVSYAHEFLGNIGIKSAAEQERVINYFNKRHVDSFKELAPGETALQQIATANYNSAVRANPFSPVGTLDEIAASKGFVVIPEGEGWIAKDIVGQGQQAPQMKFGSLDAAQTWLAQTARELPDITPPLDVPLELSAQFLREATQGPNLNPDFAKNAAVSISELSAAEGSGGFIPPEAAVAQAGGPDNIGRLKNQWFDGFTRWQPARRLWSKIDEAMYQMGSPVGLATDAERIAQRGVQNNNEMHDLMDSLTDVTRKIKTNRLVTGEWSRVAALPAGQREAAAVAAGFPKSEIEAFGEMDNLIARINQRVSGTSDPVDTASVWEYFSHVAGRQSDPALVSQAFEGFEQTPATQPFYDFVKTGNLNFREGDPRHIMESYIRAMFWQKNMAGPFAELTTKWKGMAEIEELKPVATLMQSYLKIVRYGYHAEDDIALDMLHAGLSGLLGKGVTRQQARELFNYGLNTTHSAMLGFRPHVMARDALQLFLAVPRAGADLTATLFKAITNPDEIGRLYQEAVAEGVVALQSPRMAAPGSFSGTLERLSAEPGAVESSLPLAPDQYSKRMKAAASITETVRDLMPSWLRDTRDSPLHAMYLYGKQSEVMKALVYGAGKQKAARALANFRTAGPNGSLDELMGASAARTFDPSWQRQFQQLVASGDDDAAAKYLGKQLADATQFKYGQLEAPMAARSITGRVAMQMGNYQLQYIQYLRESLVNGTIGDKAKLALTFGAVTAGIEAASRETGWNFRLMNPFFGLGFVGGPWVELGVQMAQGLGTAARELQGGQPNEAAYTAAGTAGTQALQNLNPAGGLIRMAQGLGEASNSPFPGRAVGRLLLTGEMGAGPDVNQWLMPQAEAMFQRSIQPTPSPMNAAQYGLPPGVFPQQQPIYPPDMASPPSVMPQGNQSPQSSVPGGSPYGLRATPNTHTPDLINRAVQGDSAALSQFDTEDQQFLSKLGPVPPDVRMQVWSSYSIQKINRHAGSKATGTPGSIPSSISGQQNTNPLGAMQ